MEQEKISVKKKKFNGFIYVISLLLSSGVSVIFNSGTEYEINFAGESADYLIGYFVGQIFVIMFISYIIYKALNWLNINVLKE